MKNWTINFKDKRRLQRRMWAETKEEVIDYIFKKYGTGFVVEETKKVEDLL